MPYRAPLEEMLFVMTDVVGSGSIDLLPGFEDCPTDVVSAVLNEASRFGTEILAPLNQSGDGQGCYIENGTVRTPDGFAEAYRLFRKNGWNGLDLPPLYGGQGLPRLLSTAVSEIWNATNLSFALGPMLTQSGIRLLLHAGTDALRQRYLPNLVSGDWMATMNLTESQAGSDLSQISTCAERCGGHYRITGQKIFISYGDHDWAENIIHFVLARLPDAPAGIKGISLFLVPRNHVSDDGGLDTHNDVHCLSLEHKLGIHASPTAIMGFGQQSDEGADGYLIGMENEGVQTMFAMMNDARLAVGVEGVGLAEGAFQLSRNYAGNRRQGRGLGPIGGAISIVEHPDVRRMLLSMKARTEAIRALAYFVAGQSDTATAKAGTKEGNAAKAIVDLLTPVTKAWSTDTAIAVADTGIQVHGGTGYIESSGAPQFLRDARITAIYEGTNGIQARDVVSRKICRDSGGVARLLLDQMRLDLKSSSLGGLQQERPEAALAAIERLDSAIQWIVSQDDEQTVLAAATPFLKMMGITLGGWLMARAARAAARYDARGTDCSLARKKLATTRYYNENILPETLALHEMITCGSPSVLAPDIDDI
ncbi:MAG: acyl-CoA dehydrogenase [Rhodospirillales bacterium]